MKKLKIYIALLALMLAYSGSAQVYTADQINSYGNFDSYSVFTTSFAPFTSVDGDGQEEFQLNGVTWTNGDQPKAFMIFNPQQTDPAMADYWMKARSGYNLLMGANNRYYPADNWFMTPKVQLHGGHPSVTFYCNTYHPQILEQFEVYVSNTDNNISSFKKISPGDYLEAPYMYDAPNPSGYRKMSFDLTEYSNQVVYIAIHHITQGGILIGIDDFSIDDGTQGIYSPITDFTVDQTTIAESLSVTFSDQSQNNPTSWQWEFIGGTPAASTEQNPTVTYNNYGKFLAKLTATNSDGSDTETKYQYIEVLQHEQLAADFTSDIIDLDEGNQVQFNDISTGAPTSWSWSFAGGDPSTSYERNPAVTYNSAGTYQVALTVTNSVSNDTETKFGYITVTVPAPPVADFVADFVEIPKDATIQFTDQSTNRPTSWSWSFSGGTPSSSTEQNPQVTYNTTGTYQVSLTVTNALGTDTETKTAFINVVDLSGNYCTAVNETENLSITNVELAEINNNSDGATFTGYQDHTSNIAFLEIGDSYPMEVEMENSHWEYDALGVWIDWNQDGDFDDANETVYSMNSTGVFKTTVTPPSDATLGLTMMRVRNHYSKDPFACGTDTYMGEVEDYAIFVTDNVSGDTEAPTAPTGLASGNVSTTTVDLSWNASTDNVEVTGYNVYVGDAVAMTSATTSCTLSGLTANTLYTISVKAYDAAGNISLASNHIEVTTDGGGDNEAPTIPTGLAADNIEATQFDLSWNASSDNVGVTGYDVFKDGAYVKTVGSISTTITGLSANTTYAFTVKAKDAAGNISDASSALGVTTLDDGDYEAPSIPTGLAAAHIAQTSVDLTWNASSDNVGVTGYDVLQDGAVVSTVTGTSETISGLTTGSTYSFTVRAKDAAGNLSDESAAISVTIPDCTYCTSQGNAFNYEWISEVAIGVFNNSSNAAGYTDFTGQTVILSAGTSVDVTLTPGFASSSYSEYWKIWIDFNNDCDFDDAGEELFSSSGSAAVTGSISIPSTASGTTRMRVSMKYNAAPTTCESFSYGEVEDYTVVFSGGDTEPPSTPTGLSTSGVTMNSVTLSWNASTDNVGVTGYDVLQDGVSVQTVTNTSVTITGLTLETSYAFTIVAKDAAGNESVPSTALNVTTLGDTEAPTAPTGLSATNVETTSLNLSWTASTDNIGVTEYDVLQDGAIVRSIAGTSTSITGLTQNTTYEFTVQAKDAAGNISSLSAPLSVTTQGVDTEAPSIPTGLAANNVTATSADLTWNASTDNVGVTEYEVLQDGAVIESTSSTSITATGLTINTTYEFTVRAKDAAGNTSAESSSVSVTTGGCTYCTSQGNSSSYEWISEVTIGTFTNSSNAAGYTDFTSQTINLSAGSTVDVTLTPGFASSAYTEYWKIWIDLNNDCDFDDAGEELFSNSGNSAVSGTITIPASATGETVMRISMKYNAAQTTCESFSYGEVEDYKVSFTPETPDTEAPTVPTSLTASNITTNSINLSWNASTDNVAVTGYQVLKDGVLETTISGISTTIAGLAENTSYSFTVKATDAAGNISGESNTASATTLEGGTPVSYCDVTHTNPTDYFYIENVTFESINNTTVLGNTSTCYSDYTNLSASVAKGNSYNLSVNWTPSWSSNSSKVYIDWNQDGDFDDADETVMNVLGSSLPYSTSVSVPSSALSGSTRMRVRVTYSSTITPCGSLVYGETEDYTVSVSDGAPTPISDINNLEVKLFPNPTSDLVTLSISGAEEAIVELYRLNGQKMLEKEITASIAEISVSHLPAGIYYVKVISQQNSVTEKLIVK